MQIHAKARVSFRCPSHNIYIVHRFPRETHSVGLCAYCWRLTWSIEYATKNLRSSRAWKLVHELVRLPWWPFRSWETFVLVPGPASISSRVGSPSLGQRVTRDLPVNHRTHRLVAELFDSARHVSVAAQLRGDVGRYGRVEKRPDQKVGHLFLLLLRVEFLCEKNKKKKKRKILIKKITSAYTVYIIYYMCGYATDECFSPALIEVEVQTRNYFLPSDGFYRWKFLFLLFFFSPRA